AFVGPLAGGFFVTWADWRTGFGFFGLQAAALALWIWFGLRSVPEAPAASSARLPWRRLALLALALLGVGCAGIVAAAAVLSLALGVAALGLCARRAARAGEARLWPRRALAPRGAAGAVVVMVLVMHVATMGVAPPGPILLERIHGTPLLASCWIVAIVSIA